MGKDFEQKKHECVKKFVTNISPANEVPPVTGSAATGSGKAILKSSCCQGALKFKFCVTGLSSGVTGVHFHQAPAGSNGSIVRNLSYCFDPITNTVKIAGVWSSCDLVEPLTPTLIQALLSNNIYVNVHSVNNPSGEARGQLVLDNCGCL